MAAESDLPYVSTQTGRREAQPVILINRGNWTDRSGTIVDAETPEVLFDAIEDKSTIQRFVQNIEAEGNLWVNYFGNDAGVKAPGSMKVVPGAVLFIPTDGEVSICSDAPNMAFTAGEC